MKSTSSRLSDLHFPLMLVVFFLAALGCYNLHSAAAAHEPHLYVTQIMWFLIGTLIAALVLLVDYRVSESIAYVAYGITCVLLMVVLLSGKTAMGARRWLVIGPLTFQPSEMAKISIIFCMARYFSYRVEPNGYSMLSLIRPLNPTRPLACAILLSLYWNKPWLIDPVGELSRFIYHKLNGTLPVLEDLLWFRLFVILLLLFSCTLCLWGVIVSEQAARLLNPWPQNRRKRVMVCIALLFVASNILIVKYWYTPFLRDPFGLAITMLHQAASTGGMYESVQPSLVLRLLLVMLLTVYFAASIFSLRRYVRRLVDVLIAPLDILAIPALLVLIQPDLGTAGIIILIGMTMIWVVGVKLRSLIILGMMSACISCVAWFGILKDYQKRRILTFIDPEQDIKGAGWNAVQSIIAVGSGRLFGKGHMGGTQTQLSFLPEQHTDFAFSVWAEEQGFMGCFVLLVLYLALLVIAFAIATEARDTYGVLLATGVASLILWQAVINIGMVIGVLPVVGLTLPLFSYGGSSVLTVMFGVGLLLNVHFRRRAH